MHSTRQLRSHLQELVTVLCFSVFASGGKERRGGEKRFFTFLEPRMVIPVNRMNLLYRARLCPETRLSAFAE